MYQDYDKLLKRARDNLPKEIFESVRFEIPGASVIFQGNRSIVTNFNDITEKLNRDPQHLLKYLNRELGTASTVQGAKAMFKGRFGPALIDKRIKEYASEFIICHECKKPDTKIMKEGRIHIIKCEACGAKAAIRTI